MAIKTVVHTLGDSTLDNLYWMTNGRGDNLKDAEADSIEGKLQEKLGTQGYLVVSHAYDGFTTRNVLQGGEIGAVFPWEGPKKAAYVQAKKGNSDQTIVYPLHELERHIEAHPNVPHYVVLSVGGNDFRANLETPWKLLTIIPNVQDRYFHILDRIQQLRQGSDGRHREIRPILMFQYRTARYNDPYLIYRLLGVLGCIHLVCLSILGNIGLLFATGRIRPMTAGIFSSLATAFFVASLRAIPFKVTLGILRGQHPGVAMIGALMEKLYYPILERAKNDKIPILDLPNSFNPYQDLYIAGIEPNKSGGEKIAQGLAKIIKEHHYPSESQLYRCNGRSRPNRPQEWQVAYPRTTSTLTDD